MQQYEEIINHFGLRAQMKKLNEETYELLEAIDNYEDAWLELEGHEPYYTAAEMAIFRDHVVEEMGDVLILLTQFIARYGIDKSELDVWMDSKLERTRERIKTGYYEKGE
jgi:NTP pyrophosphatase (non-canonical NTP hydrolase)